MSELKGDGKITILTPFVSDFKEVITESKMTAEYIYMKATYPNGVIIETWTYPNETVVKCNKEIINNGDGTASIVL